MRRFAMISTLGALLAFSAGCPTPMSPGDGNENGNENVNASNGNSNSGNGNTNANAGGGNGNGNANSGNSNSGGSAGNGNGNANSSNNNANGNGNGNTNANDNGSGPPPVQQFELNGVWQIESPALIEPFGYNPTEFVEFREDGTATYHGRDPATEFVSCATASFVDLGSAIVTTFLSEGGSASLSLYDFEDKDTLVLTDAFLQDHTFKRVAAVADALQCGSIEVVKRTEALESPTYATGLAFDGTLLWYTNEADVTRSLNPETGQYVNMIAFSDARFVHAVDGPDFWLDCFCGGDEVQKRSAANVLLDRIKVEDDFGVSPDAVARDALSGEILISGSRRDTRQEVLLRINVAVTPQQLIAEVPIYDGQALSMDNGRLWAYTFPNFVSEIDIATGKSLKTYVLPQGRFDYRGFAVAGDRVFMIAEVYRGGSELSSGLLIEAKFIE